jgi:hypothetical protein
MNLKKFSDLAGSFRERGVHAAASSALVNKGIAPPETPADHFDAGKAIAYQRCADELNGLISDTEDDMPDYGADSEFCLCDGCGLPIEPTKMFHSDRCVRRYSKAHAHDHGKDNEDE